MRRTLLLLLAVVGSGAAMAQPTLYADDVLALIVERLGGTEGEIFLGVNAGFEHPEYPEITINVSAHDFRVPFLEDGGVVNPVIACGIGLEPCAYRGSDLIAVGFKNNGAYIELGTVCNNPSAPMRGRSFNGTLPGTLGACMNAHAAAGHAVSEMQGLIGYVTYAGNAGSWAQTRQGPTSAPGPYPSNSEFEGTIWAGVLAGVGKYDCPTCTVEALENYGVFIVGSYIDGGPRNPANDPGDPGGPGGGGPGWDDAPDDPGTNCSIIDIPCNLRKLFVPADPWETRVANLWDTMSTRAPLGYLGLAGSAFMNGGSGEDWNWAGGAPVWWSPGGGWGGPNTWNTDDPEVLDIGCAGLQARFAFDLSELRDGFGHTGPGWVYEPQVCESEVWSTYRDRVRPAVGVLLMLGTVLFCVNWIRGM
jgi:hypothetical protein